MSYFPNAAGDEWFYAAATDDPNAPAPTSIQTVSVNGTKSVLGASATVFTAVDSSKAGSSIDSYYAVSGGGITAVGNTDPADAVTPLIAPYVALLFPVQTGMVSSLSGSNLPLGKDTAGNPITLSLTQTIVNVDVEAVSVTGGDFPNAMKQVTTINGTASDAATGQSVPVTGIDTQWLVPGVGVVQDISTATANGATINASKALRGYTVNGMHRGIGAPYSLAPTGAGGGLTISPAAVGFDGTHFLTVYQSVSGAAPNIQTNWYAGAFLIDGTALTSTNITGAVPASSFPELPAVASDGSRFLIAIQQNTQPANLQENPLIAVTLFAADGSIAPSFNTIVPSGAFYPALAFDGSNYLLVYAQGAAMARQLFGVFISPTTGQANGAAFAITGFGGVKESTALAFDGTNYLVVWRDDADMGVPATPGLYGLRISPSGAIQDAQPIPIALDNPTQVGQTTNPALAFDGTNYLVVYMDNRPQASGFDFTISAARISTAGALLDGSATVAGIAVTSATGVSNNNPAVAFIGGQYWVSWVTTSTNAAAGDLYGERISAAGQVLVSGTSGFRAAPAGPALFPAIAGNASGGVLLWTEDTATPTSNAIAAQAVYPAGP